MCTTQFIARLEEVYEISSEEGDNQNKKYDLRFSAKLFGKNGEGKNQWVSIFINNAFLTSGLIPYLIAGKYYYVSGHIAKLSSKEINNNQSFSMSLYNSHISLVPSENEQMHTHNNTNTKRVLLSSRRNDSSFQASENINNEGTDGQYTEEEDPPF